MQILLAYTFILCCALFMVLPIFGYAWSKNRYPLYTPTYLECWFCGFTIVGAVATVVSFFWGLLWSLQTLLGA